MLAAYIQVSASPEDQGLRSLADDLANLARLNQSFEASPREQADFDRWSPQAKSLIARLEDFTAARFSSDQREAAGR